MAQKQPPTLLPSSQSTATTFSGIDAAVASIIENNPSCSTDIIGTAVSLSTVTMDRIESMMQKLRTRGKRLPKSKAPLTVARPFARAVSPPPKTAISPLHPTARSMSPEPRTAFEASPVSSRQLFPNPQSSTKTGREITPRPSQVYQRLVPAAPSDSSVRTGRGKSPGPRSSGYPTAVSPHASDGNLPTNRSDAALQTGRGVSPGPRSSGYPTAISPAPTLSPASRRQSISNAQVPSTRTGREITPRPSDVSQRSSGYPTALAPSTSVPSTRTGREVTPRPSKGELVTARSESPVLTGRELTRRPSFINLETARSESPVRTGRGVSPGPRSSGYPTAVSAATPPNPASRRQSISNLKVPSTRTGREITPRPSETLPSVTGEDKSEASVRTARPVTPHSGSRTSVNKPLTPAEQWANVKPGAGPKIVAAKSPTLSTARDSQAPKSNRQLQPQPKADEIWNDLVKTAEKQKIPSDVRSPGLPKSNASQKSLRTGRGVSPGPRSSGYPTAISAATPPNPASRRQSISNAQVPSTRTGREVTPRPSKGDLATARSESAVRTGRGMSPCPRSSGYPTAISPGPNDGNLAANRSEPAVRTGRGVSPGPRSSGYPTAISAATPPNPASRRQSISNLKVPSTRTGREVTPRPSKGDLATARSESGLRTGRGVSPGPRSSGYPTAISAATPSTRTGREITSRPSDVSQRSSGYPTALAPSAESLNSNEMFPPLNPHSASGYQAVSPAPTLSPASRRQSISNAQVPSTRTGREVTPRPSKGDLATARSESGVRTGRGASRSQRSSGYPTAISPGPQSSTRTGREATTPQKKTFRPAAADNVLDKSTRTGREASPRIPPTAANPQLISRTSVAAANENGEEEPGVLLFVHSYYVFSMTLDAWANHLANQKPAQ